VLGIYAPLLLNHLLALTNVRQIIFGLKSLLLLPCYSAVISALVIVKVKVKQSRYGTGVAQRFPGS
jgi:hypothetical protein